jgi:WS/DGAT/MGAT family acyltransferase
MASNGARPALAGERHERMSAVDTAWLRMDGPANAMMIVSVMTTATPVRAADLRRVLETRLLCFPRFRKRPVQDALGASWHEQADFNLDRHFVVSTLPAPGGSAQLQERVAQLCGQRFDPSQPLWQVHFIEHYGTGSAWVLRLHHCYADGIAMVRVLLSLTEQDPGPALAGAKPGPARSPGPAARLAESLPLVRWLEQLSQPASDMLENALANGVRLLEGGVHRVFHPETMAEVLRVAGGMGSEFARVLALPDDPPTPLRVPLSGEKRVAWSEPLPLEEVRLVARALGCTVNDVVLATVAGALGAHLRESCRCDTDGLVLRASVPVNLRAAEEPMTLGNKFGLVFVELPVGLRDPLRRVYAMNDTMRALKDSLQPPMSLSALGMFGLLPGAWQGAAIELFSRKGSLVASNVPGPTSPLTLCGQRIDEMYFWVPQSGSIGIGVSVLSYAGRVCFGLIADRACLDEPASVAVRFRNEFERLLLASTVGALALHEQGPQRRKPLSGKDKKPGHSGSRGAGNGSARAAAAPGERARRQTKPRAHTSRASD